MFRKFVLFSGLAIATIWLMLFLAVIASAAGGGSAVQSQSLNTSINLGDLQYSMNTYNNGGDSYNLGMNLSISSGVINNASIQVFRDPSDPVHGEVYANISGVLDVTPSSVAWQSQSVNISRRGGLDFNSYAGIGSFQQQYWNGTGLVLGDIYSEASLSMRLSDVASINYANSNYYEQDAQTWTWTDPYGNVYTQNTPASFSGYAMWDVDFSSSAGAAMAAAVPSEISTVPEPSTFALLGAGALGLGTAVWRKRR